MAHPASLAIDRREDPALRSRAGGQSEVAPELTTVERKRELVRTGPLHERLDGVHGGQDRLEVLLAEWNQPEVGPWWRRIDNGAQAIIPP